MEEPTYLCVMRAEARWVVLRMVRAVRIPARLARWP